MCGVPTSDHEGLSLKVFGDLEAKFEFGDWLSRGFRKCWKWVAVSRLLEIGSQ